MFISLWLWKIISSPGYDGRDRRLKGVVANTARMQLHSITIINSPQCKTHKESQGCYHKPHGVASLTINSSQNNNGPLPLALRHSRGCSGLTTFWRRTWFSPGHGKRNRYFAGNCPKDIKKTLRYGLKNSHRISSYALKIKQTYIIQVNEYLISNITAYIFPLQRVF